MYIEIHVGLVTLRTEISELFGSSDCASTNHTQQIMNLYYDFRANV